MKTRLHITVWLFAAATLILCGCAMDEFAKVGSSLGQEAGVVTKDQADSINRGAGAVSKAAEDFTPEQEHYIGRSVGATLLARYKPYNDSQANNYINMIGASLALASDKPETFSGYHFQIMDSTEINAFAAPGGFIFVTRGMLGLCKNEDEIAAVLAHEVAHAALGHGIQAIKTSRKTEALKILAVEGTKTFGGKELSDLTNTFESSIGDITSTLVNNGYSRGFEREADAAAIKILSRIGYDPGALTSMLQEMGKKLKSGGPDFAKTHPSPASRISDLPASSGAKAQPAARKARYEKVMRYL